MIKQLIMFIAYKTTENLADPRRGTMGHFARAQIFITFAIAINLVEIVLIVNALFFKSKFDFTDEKFFLLYLVPFSIYFPVNFIFKKNTLAKSLKSYKESKLAEVARAIGLSYLLLNFGLVIYLIFIMITFY